MQLSTEQIAERSISRCARRASCTFVIEALQEPLEALANSCEPVEYATGHALAFRTRSLSNVVHAILSDSAADREARASAPFRAVHQWSAWCARIGTISRRRPQTLKYLKLLRIQIGHGPKLHTQVVPAPNVKALVSGKVAAHR